jgi:hypothetical protein
VIGWVVCRSLASPPSNPAVTAAVLGLSSTLRRHGTATAGVWSSILWVCESVVVDPQIWVFWFFAASLSSTTEFIHGGSRVGLLMLGYDSLVLCKSRSFDLDLVAWWSRLCRGFYPRLCFSLKADFWLERAVMLAMLRMISCFCVEEILGCSPKD